MPDPATRDRQTPDLLALDWNQLDLEHGLLHKRREKSGTALGIPLTNRLTETLVELQEASGKVFLQPDGKSWHPETVARYHTLAKSLAGITRRFRFHDLRHDFASSLAKQGVSLYTIATLLGHSSTKTTQRYAHLSPSDLASAVEGLGR